MITSPGVSGFIDRYYSVYLVFKLSAQLFEIFYSIFSQNYFYKKKTRN